MLIEEPSNYGRNLGGHKGYDGRLLGACDCPVQGWFLRSVVKRAIREAGPSSSLTLLPIVLRIELIGAERNGRQRNVTTTGPDTGSVRPKLLPKSSST